MADLKFNYTKSTPPKLVLTDGEQVEVLAEFSKHISIERIAAICRMLNLEDYLEDKPPKEAIDGQDQNPEENQGPV